MLRPDHVRRIAKEAVEKRIAKEKDDEEKRVKALVRLMANAAEEAILAAARKGEFEVTVRYDEDPPQELIELMADFSPDVHTDDDCHYVTFSWNEK